MRMLAWKRSTVVAAALLAVLAFSVCQAADQRLLYTLSKDGAVRGYLLGTVHSDDPRVVNFSPQFTEALKSCDRFAMEIVPDQPTLSRLMDYMHYDDGSKLVDRIGKERYERLLKVVQGYHLTADQMTTMKVWAAMITISIPPPENGLFMDLALALQAAGFGLKVVGLETLEEQLSFLQDMPADQQLIMLDQALDEFDQLPEFYDELIEDYLKSDLAALRAQSESQMEELPAETAEYFFSKGIDARNLLMSHRLVAELESGNVFAAVGALHLPGERGIVSLLRSKGFTVEPAPFSPFAQ